MPPVVVQQKRRASRHQLNFMVMHMDTVQYVIEELIQTADKKLHFIRVYESERLEEKSEEEKDIALEKLTELRTCKPATTRFILSELVKHYIKEA